MVIDLRAAIELWSFLQITQRFHDAPYDNMALVGKLNTLLNTMSKAIANQDANAVIQADYDFHRCIIEGVSNTLFVEFYDILRSFLLKEIEASQTAIWTGQKFSKNTGRSWTPSYPEICKRQ